MSTDRECPDCGEPLEAMELQGSSALGDVVLVSDESADGLFGGLRADEILEPVPYVCPACRRTLFYAEE
ncbi:MULTISPECIES: hypothetical protein [Halolamina]|uniref:Small CPxCG-related zinc finger protein n=1 Tax=Halolamina pelagica TaxID=699431 RepID=A0A1I5TTX3_9EURY|nr:MULTISPECIES: hypothetical protein [Halolamina]NHX37802.1 hypothetical protein [Halolamina sp. R1-12]SFP86522.1 hypothetical protein SAMN05216277_11085 [Halolamina pelagica]